MRYLDEAVTAAGGIALRYGLFHGAPNDGLIEPVRKRQFPIVGDGGGYSSFVHLDAAAAATVLALEHDGPAIYNVVDDAASGRLGAACSLAGERDELRPQLTALFTSATIRSSSAGVSALSAKEVDHMLPSSRFAAPLKPNVAYLSLNFDGNLTPSVEIPLQAVVSGEITLAGSCAFAGELGEALDLLAAGTVDVAPLVSAVVPLEEGPAVARPAARRRAGRAQGAADPMSGFDLSGRVALVTGASRGLGEAMALALARAGADVAVTSRSVESLAGVRAAIESLGRTAFPVALDVREHDSIRRAAGAAIERFGRVDVLVNNAGLNVRKPALELTWEEWNLVLDTNLRGAFFVAQAVAPGMIERGRGRIVNIGSVTSVLGAAAIAPYGASRGGIKQLTMSLADEWGPYGVTVNCLAPGSIRTAQTEALYQSEA